MNARTATPARLARAAAAAVLATALPVSLSAQCAMCRSLLSTPEGQQLVDGLRSGILLLLAAPFVAFGTVAFFAVRTERRRRQSSDAHQRG